jgi:hypothetical protein
MSEKKVLTDPNLLNIILSFTGIEIKKKCNVCGTILKYQILNQEVEYDHKSYINFELCKKVYFCSEDCSYMYKKQFNNERCCLLSTLLCVSVGLLICLVVLLNSEEPPTININLSV